MNAVKILIATKNQHKARELAALAPPSAEVYSLLDWEKAHGLTLEEPEENGPTFLANARIKAKAYAAATGLITLADDSGLSVSALGGAPGILSARFGGEGLSDRQRYLLLLHKMKNKRYRRAFFTTALVLARPDGANLHWIGRLEGVIVNVPKGQYGFGYDPIFRKRGLNLTMAQLTSLQKNAISHRALAALAFSADMETVDKFINLVNIVS